jgi:acyl-CoA hydrolase
MTMLEYTADTLDLARFIRAGDSIFVGQGTAEAQTLTEALVRQRAQIGRTRVFLGPVFSSTWQPEHVDYIDFSSYGALGASQRLAKAGALQVVPSHMSQLPDLIDSGVLRADVVLIQLSGANEHGEYSFGLANDYLVDAMRRARVVIAEVNDQVPWTYGSEQLSQLRIDCIVRTSRPLLELKSATIGDTERRIGAHAAQFIGDGAVLETGIGAIPDAVLSALHDRRDLGVHSGMIGDSMVALMKAGVITNARKTIDRGIGVAGVLFGTRKLYDFAHANPQLRLSPVRHTHDVGTIGALDNFIAVNSAIEVDLTGQVNAELVGEDYIGAVGGQVDFIRGAWRSRGGRSIIALPATAKGNTLSRVVDRFAAGVTTTPRSDADIIVTEWGAAQLRGQTVAERMRRMIEIAHPDFREELARTAHARLRSGD